MYSYRAFALGLKSELPLPGLPPGGGAVDVTIRQRCLQSASLADLHDGGDHVCGLIADGRFRFCVEQGSEITVDHDDDFPSHEMIPTILSGVVLSSLLFQRGLLVLHASTVAKDGAAIAFLGDSGWGKSTLAELFCQRGYTLLSDDILAVDFGGAAPTAIPGFPQVKLMPDAGAHLRSDYEALPELYAESGKRVHLPADNFESSPCRLAGLYVLENVVADRNQLVEISPVQQLSELIRHTRMYHLFTQPAYRKRHLEQCSALIRHVPVRLLRRIRSLEGLPELFDVVDGSVLRPGAMVHV